MAKSPQTRPHFRRLPRPTLSSILRKNQGRQIWESPSLTSLSVPKLPSACCLASPSTHQCPPDCGTWSVCSRPASLLLGTAVLTSYPGAARETLRTGNSVLITALLQALQQAVRKRYLVLDRHTHLYGGPLPISPVPFLWAP